ncbi:MAG: alpha/beta hydrolase [Clostridia bacterium]|nr:alpha/beta hydrolase [Clostridia bacterium]
MKIIRYTPAVEGMSQPDVKLDIYLQEPSAALAIKERPMILICPGGAYAYTSDREAEPLALTFLAMGYDAAVLRYSVAPVRYPVALQELAKSVAYIRNNAAQWHVLPDKLFVLGCSAGGHLAANLGVQWNDAEVMTGAGIPADNLKLVRPDGLILCYPVITSGKFAHKGSFENLLGERNAEEGPKHSLENQVTPDMPPVFLWHTFTDQAVPVENSLLLASALRAAGVSLEMHIFERGVHGLSLANAITENPEHGESEASCTSWVGLVHTWLEARCGY